MLQESNNTIGMRWQYHGLGGHHVLPKDRINDCTRELDR